MLAAVTTRLEMPVALKYNARPCVYAWGWESLCTEKDVSSAVHSMKEMVQRSRGSGSVPVSFMPAMLGCTKHPSVGTHRVRQRLVTATEMLVTVRCHREGRNPLSQQCGLRFRDAVRHRNSYPYPYTPVGCSGLLILVTSQLLQTLIVKWLCFDEADMYLQ